jgi:hypothetical protein
MDISAFVPLQDLGSVARRPPRHPVLSRKPRLRAAEAEWKPASRNLAGCLSGQATLARLLP